MIASNRVLYDEDEKYYLENHINLLVPYNITIENMKVSFALKSRKFY